MEPPKTPECWDSYSYTDLFTQTLFSADEGSPESIAEIKVLWECIEKYYSRGVDDRKRCQMVSILYKRAQALGTLAEAGHPDAINLVLGTLHREPWCGSGAKCVSHFASIRKQAIKGLYKLCQDEAIEKKDQAVVPVKDANLATIGGAPLASRPSWLPLFGPGQRKVPPQNWSITVAQWVFFMRACVRLPTWHALADIKGDEYKVNMYDVNDHFVKPWTKGTGNSIGLLMNHEQPQGRETDLMLSHAWAGSVIETMNCLVVLANRYEVPLDAAVCYCVFSQYQPEDHHPDGLTIQEQLDLKAFALIIASKPRHGMCVVHTTLHEVYNRMWAVHEVDESLFHGVTMRGVFDEARWKIQQFEQSKVVASADAQCLEKDRKMLEKMIAERGGFDRLDTSIAEFRAQMQAQLTTLLKEDSGEDNSDCRVEIRWKQKGEWLTTESWIMDHSCVVYTRWSQSEAWDTAMKEVAESFGTVPKEAIFGPKGFCAGEVFFPMGRDSFLYGKPGSTHQMGPRWLPGCTHQMGRDSCGELRDPTEEWFRMVH